MSSSTGINKDVIPRSLTEDDVEAVPVKRNVLSQVSANYDVGSKGYLDETEKVMRSYDTNNDGTIDNNELKQIVRDLKTYKQEKTMFKKIAWIAIASVVVLLLSNFGLVWGTLALTRQLEIQEGSLVESSTGKKVSTLARGNHIEAKVNPEYVRRLLILHGRRLISASKFNFRHEVRKLMAGVPVAVLEEDRFSTKEKWVEYTEGVPIAVSVTIDGTVRTGIVGSGVKLTQTDNQDIYDDVYATDQPNIKYQVKCYVTGNCEAFNSTVPEDTPALEDTPCSEDEPCQSGEQCLCSEWQKSDYEMLDEMPESECVARTCQSQRALNENECFSPLSTIVEKSKGQVFLKDLKPGDYVLASDGAYQQYLFSAHSHPSKPTSFMQIHTNSFMDAPFEATPGHLVFLHGNDVPIQAGKVKVGDTMVGVNGPKTVTKVTTVTREGFYNALTADATIFVDGVLASSMTVLEEDTDDVFVNFGLHKIHVHTLFNRAAAPLIQAWCGKLNAFFCNTQVDDGSGGSLNVLVGSARVVLTLPLAMQALIFSLFIGVASIGFLSYYLVLFLVPSTILLGVSNPLEIKMFKLNKKKVI